uniref:Metastasis-associated protein MTA1 R1 domain-containing protein n=1 Tax=Sus scrofa TaxID=9823 RepID=A0A8D0N7B9_PIG
MKTRQAFYLHTTKLTRIARRLCREILRPWHAARHPYMPINSAAIKAECTARLPEAAQSPLVLKQAVRKPLEAVLRYLETHPRPPKPDPVKNVSGVLSGLAPAKSAPVINNGSPTILGKRSYEQHNGVDGLANHGQTRHMVRGTHLHTLRRQPRQALPRSSPPPSLRGTRGGVRLGVPTALRGSPARRSGRVSPRGFRADRSRFPPQGPSRNLLLNGKAYPTKVRLIRGGSLPPVKRRRMNWIDAPDDVFYMATEETRCGPRGRGGAGAPRPRRSRRSPSPAAPLT